MGTLSAVKFGFTLFEIAEHMEPALLSVVEKFEAANGHRPTVADVAPEIANLITEAAKDPVIGALRI